MNDDIEYQATLDYLYSFVDFSLSKTIQHAPAKFELGRMQRFVDALGKPQQKYPVIHVAGTKGKGSVTAMCASILQAAGYKVGMYTSPHLLDYCERIKINNQPIPHRDLVKLVEEFKPRISVIPELTTFEITTALAFEYFAQEGVDVAVIEVGLGGRLDSTNVVLPVVSVITSISYDHTYVLGNTLTEIATEKAGIIKPGILVVISPQEKEAQQAIVKIAKERGALTITVGQDVHYCSIRHTIQGQTIEIWQDSISNDQQKKVTCTIPLLGTHQIENAATAFAAIDKFRSLSLPINDESIVEGFARVDWPGRFEIFQRNPFLILDCAHNRESAKRLCQTLNDYFPDKEVIMVFGASDDKDIRGMFLELVPRVRKVYATSSFHPRAIDAEFILSLANELKVPCTIVADVADAVKEALMSAGEDNLVLVTGSIFVVAGAREALLSSGRNE